MSISNLKKPVTPPLGNGELLFSKVVSGRLVNAIDASTTTFSANIPAGEHRANVRPFTNLPAQWTFLAFNGTTQLPWTFSTGENLVYFSTNVTSIQAKFNPNQGPNDAWTTRVSAFGTTNIENLTYGNGIYLAGGEGSSIRSSTDTITWTTLVSGFSGTPIINALAYGNGIYLAATSSGTLRISTDSVTWTSVNPFFSVAINNIAYGNGVFVAGGNEGSVRTSTNGITWSSTNALMGTSVVSALTYGNGRFVLGGAGGALRTSTNGVTWTSVDGFSTTRFADALYANNLFVAGGVGGVLRTSTDGITWVSRNVGYATTVRALAYGNGIYISGADGGFSTVSTDGITWSTTAFQAVNFGISDINKIIHANDVFIAGGNGGSLKTISSGAKVLVQVYSTKYPTTLIM